MLQSRSPPARCRGGGCSRSLALAACGEDESAESSGGDVGGGGGEESFYEGSTVDLVVPFEPGGGYDTYARALAPYLGDCLDATVVVQNEPGAGGLLATNNTFNASPDDRRIQIVNSIGSVSAQIAGDEGVQFDMTEFSSIGRIVATQDTVAVAPGSELQDFQDIIDAEGPVRFSATGPGANDYITPNVLGVIYGFEPELITGFQGSGEARLALVQGEVGAYVQSWDSMLDAIESSEVTPVLVAAEESVEQLPGVPTLADYEPVDKSGEQLREELTALEETGRGVVAPPGLPEDRLNELRDAFTCAFDNEELRSQLEEQGRPLGVLSGEEWQEIVDEALNSSEEFQSIITESF